MRCPPSFFPAALLLLFWCTPTYAQGDTSVPIVGYGAALVATIIVLLIVCWPAKRQDE